MYSKSEISALQKREEFIVLTKYNDGKIIVKRKDDTREGWQWDSLTRQFYPWNDDSYKALANSESLGDHPVLPPRAIGAMDG